MITIVVTDDKSCVHEFGQVNVMEFNCDSISKVPFLPIPIRRDMVDECLDCGGPIDQEISKDTPPRRMSHYLNVWSTDRHLTEALGIT